MIRLIKRKALNSGVNLKFKFENNDKHLLKIRIIDKNSVVLNEIAPERREFEYLVENNSENQKRLSLVIEDGDEIIFFRRITVPKRGNKENESFMAEFNLEDIEFKLDDISSTAKKFIES